MPSSCCSPAAFRDATQPEDGREAVQARPNVLFEAGLALGRKPDHTILVQLGPHRPFSDIGGRYVIRFDGSSAMRNEVATRLEAAGCPVDRRGHDWLVAGQNDFDEALKRTAWPRPTDRPPESCQPSSLTSSASIAWM